MKLLSDAISLILAVLGLSAICIVIAIVIISDAVKKMIQISNR